MHMLDTEAAACLLDVKPELGLSAHEASARLSSLGANKIPQPPGRSPWHVLLAQFKSILILILFGAVILATLVGSTKDAAVILSVVVINALVGFYQEYRAENVFNARNESGSAFNARLFDNRMLWLSLTGALALQILAVHWTPASQLFGTTGMRWGDWILVVAVASTVLLFEETRKVVFRALASRRAILQT
jgi:magnesium-transporting ATPase (P-type)